MGNRLQAVLMCAVLAAALPAVADDTATVDAAVSDVPVIDQQILLDYLAGKSPFALIDARSEAEFAAGHIYNATNVPHDAVEAFAARLPEALDAPIVVYCKSGKRASQLHASLVGRGYTDVRVLGPSQMFWAGELPVFNCGEPVASAPLFERIDAD